MTYNYIFQTYNYTYKLIPSYPAPMPTWSTPAIFRTWSMCAVTYHENCTYYVIVVMSTALNVLRYTELIYHVTRKITFATLTANYRRLTECRLGDFSTTINIPRHFFLRATKRITYTYTFHSFPLLCPPAMYFYTFDVQCSSAVAFVFKLPRLLIII